MNILFCCQFYAPSVGGVQEVIKQLAERMAAHGHKVTVATTRLPNREFDVMNGVNIKEFSVAGNLASGMSGEIGAYQAYIQHGGFDVMLVYAAQQWTFDALWPVLDKINFPKVFVPCGFSGLYEPGYAQYYRDMRAVMKKFEHLVFHAGKYRDIDFARQLGMENYSVIPNGASEEEFRVVPDHSFRQRHGIAETSFLFLTVGSFTGLKGHLELAQAFAQMRVPEGRHATLILNGNAVQALDQSLGRLWGKFRGLVMTHGWRHAVSQVVRKVWGAVDSPQAIAARINGAAQNKRVLITDFPRAELTQAYMAADLFVFASNIEYSPLVLFEAAAAGTPFLAVEVGNSAEIAQWTGAGVMCPSSVDAKGYTRVDAGILAKSMADLMSQPQRLQELGAAGRRSWLERLTWSKIELQYEQIFEQLVKAKAS